MFARLMPREGSFFGLFEQLGERVAEGGRVLCELTGTTADDAARQMRIERIDEIEKAGDLVTHEITTLLHKTFVTPFDREHILDLVNAMDDILDLMQDVAESMMLYDLQRLTPEAQQLADLDQMCCDRVREAVALLSDMENAEAILRLAAEIDSLESDADRVMRSAMSKLFREESDLRQLIKLKAIYEVLESVSDKCKQVGNTLETIVLESA